MEGGARADLPPAPRGTPPVTLTLRALRSDRSRRIGNAGQCVSQAPELESGWLSRQVVWPIAECFQRWKIRRETRSDKLVDPFRMLKIFQSVLAKIAESSLVRKVIHHEPARDF